MEKTESKKSTSKPEIKTFNRKQIFWAILPWGLIIIASVGFIGVVTGWVLRSSDQGRIQYEANVLVEQLKVKE